MSTVYRSLLLLLIATTFTACASAPQQPPLTQVAPAVTSPPHASVAMAEPAKRATPVLWQVTSPRGVSYLFGTMHFGVSTQELPGEVRDAMNRSEVLVLESDPTTADPSALADMMMLPPGPSLEEQLGPRRWESLRTLLGGRFDGDVARRLRPWVLEAAVVQSLLPDRRPMDVSILELARERSMKVEFLEDWSAQVEALNSVSSAASLIEIVDAPERFRDRTLQMTSDYLEGDLAALEQHVFEPNSSVDELFAQRNRSWLPRLGDLLERGDAFVAVGVGHLVGPDSVISLLEQDGYVVRRVGEPVSP